MLPSRRAVARALVGVFSALAPSACDSGSASDFDAVQGLWVSGGDYLDVVGAHVARAHLRVREGGEPCSEALPSWALSVSGDGFRVEPVGLYAYLERGALAFSSDNEYLVYERPSASEAATVRAAPPCVGR